MSIWQIVLLAVGLAMDAFAVSVTSGIAIKKMHLRHAVVIGLFFGGFQAIMPILGWLGGAWAKDYLVDYDHWIAFGLLVLIGGKMIYEAFEDEDEKVPKDPMNVYVLFLLAIATSIDALAVGVTLSFMIDYIIMPAAVIGGITFVLSLAGTYIGDMFGHLCENKLEILGGIILIGIGTKILVEHLFFA